MALNFPDSPSNNQVFTDGTGEQWRYNSADNSWTSLGLTNAAGIIYKGSVDITAAPPAGVQSGWQYTVSKGGTANAGYGPGITGAVVAGSVVLFDGTRWVTTTSAIPSATASVAGIQTKLWKRTGTTLAPETANDALSVDGNVTLGGTGGVFFDATAKRLAVGTTAPLAIIDITGSGEPLRIQSTTASNNYITHKHNSSGDIAYIGAGGGAALSSGANTDYAIRAQQGALLFGTNGNNERARIDTSGRLLVGTSSSVVSHTDWRFQCLGQQVVGTFTGANANAYSLGFVKSRSSSVGTYTIVANNDNLGEVRFYADDGTDYETVAASIKAEVDGTPGANDMPGRLVFSTTASGASSPTERMRITNGGASRFFCSTGVDVIDSASAEAAGNTRYLYLGAHSATGTGTGTNCYRVYTNGNVQNTNNSYAGISDIKLKENIINAGSQWNDLKALQVRKYNFKPETNQETHAQIGLIAQEVELVSPGLVTESPDRDEDGNDLGTVTKSVNYSVLYMKAVKALQEAMERIETLEAKVAALEGA